MSPLVQAALEQVGIFTLEFEIYDRPGVRVKHFSTRSGRDRFVEYLQRVHGLRVNIKTADAIEVAS